VTYVTRCNCRCGTTQIFTVSPHPTAVKIFVRRARRHHEMGRDSRPVYAAPCSLALAVQLEFGEGERAQLFVHRHRIHRAVGGFSGSFERS